MIAHNQKVSLAVHTLKSSTEAWRDGDRETLARLVNEISKLEEEADSIRRNIARELAHAELDHATVELFQRLVSKTDDVANTAERAGKFLLIINNLLLPPQYKSDVVKMASLCQAATASLAEAVYCLREPAERRMEHASRISDLEKTVDDIEFKIQQEAGELQLDNWSMILFWRLILTISRVADYVEDASDELLACDGNI